jgi:hypothetical protein
MSDPKNLTFMAEDSSQKSSGLSITLMEGDSSRFSDSDSDSGMSMTLMGSDSSMETSRFCDTGDITKRMSQMETSRRGIYDLPMDSSQKSSNLRSVTRMRVRSSMPKDLKNIETDRPVGLFKLRNDISRKRGGVSNRCHACINLYDPTNSKEDTKECIFCKKPI